MLGNTGDHAGDVADGLEGDLMWADPEAPLAALRRYADAPIAPWSEKD
jgi:hypothetical protein